MNIIFLKKKHNSSSSCTLGVIMRENGDKIKKLQESIWKKQSSIFHNSQKDEELMNKIKAENKKFNAAYDMKKIEEENERIENVKRYAKEQARKEREREKREQKKKEELDKQVTENYRYLTKDNLIEDTGSQPDVVNQCNPDTIKFSFIEKNNNSRSQLIAELPLIDGGVTIKRIKHYLLSEYGLMFKNIQIIPNVQRSRAGYTYFYSSKNPHFDNINDETKLIIDPSLHDHLMECPSLFVIIIHLRDLKKYYKEKLSGVDVRIGKELLHIQNQIDDLTKEFQEFKDEMLTMMKQIKDSIVM